MNTVKRHAISETTSPYASLISLDHFGYAKSDMVIPFTITPAEYTATTAYMVILKNGEAIEYIPVETHGQGTATIGRGFWFDINSTYSIQLKLNIGTGVEISSDIQPLKLVMFDIVKPADLDKILIKNDSNGDPKMDALTARVEIKSSGFNPAIDVNSQKMCWKFKVEYNVNITKSGAEYRSRKGLDPSGAGSGADGYLIPPYPLPPAPGQLDCKEWDGATFIIDETGSSGAKWENKFGGGTLTITAKTTIEGTNISDTYTSAIQGQKNGTDSTATLVDTKFKEYVCKYLEAPTGVQNYQADILDVLGHNKVFRIIAYHESAHTYNHFERLSDGNWKNLGPVLGYSSDYVFPLLNKSGKWGNPSSDGGFGLMQLTDPAPSYLQIWNWKKNIDGGVDLIKDKIRISKYLLKNLSGGQLPGMDSIGKSILRMETYYQYGRHKPGIKTYWLWDERDGWVFSTENQLYSDEVREVEDAVDASQYSLLPGWKYSGE